MRVAASPTTIELKGFIPRHLRPLIGNHISAATSARKYVRIMLKRIPPMNRLTCRAKGFMLPIWLRCCRSTKMNFAGGFAAVPLSGQNDVDFAQCSRGDGNNRAPEAVPALTAALNDEEPLVRGHVAWALGRIGTSEALATLRQKLLSEANPEVKSEIEEALREASEPVPDHL